MDSRSTSARAGDSGSKKGAKLRSTCDACKDAKVRCNREAPSCYRCRNQKLRCVYNLSRRMGRPRRNRTDDKSDDVGSGEGEHRSGADTSTNPWDDIRTRDSAPAEPAPYFDDGYLGRRDHSSGSRSDDARIPEEGVISSLMDPFNHPDDYDLNQLSESTGIPDLDQMIDFDFANGPGPTDASGPSAPSPSHTEQAMSPQVSSTLDRVTTQDLYNAAPKPAPVPGTTLSDSSAHTLAETNLMLMDPLGQRPMSSSGDPSHSDILPNNAKRSVIHPTDCGCYENLLQKLSDIDEGHSDNFSSIDVALMLEQWVQIGITQVLRCGGMCATRRPTLLLLLAIIINHVVCMLEDTSSLGNGNFPIESSMESTPTPSNRPATQPSSFRRPQIADMIGTNGGTSRGGSSTPKPTTPDRPPLLVGSHEILSEEKNDFLKHFLQGRLSGLSATLRQLMQYMQRSGSRQNSNCRHAMIMVSDTYKKLQSIIGRMEMWEG